MQNGALIGGIQQKFQSLQWVMDERTRRLWAATEAAALGHGGIRAVAAATGLSRTTVRAGLKELEALPAREAEFERRVRRPGGGRKRLTEKDRKLGQALEAMVDPTTRGDPQAPLRWTCKSTRKLADELARRGHPVSDRTVSRLLQALGYSLQANRKTREGASHPDRNAQFEYINKKVQAFQRQGQPVVSVDTKKKELIGDFKQSGREWRPQGMPEEVRIHDFVDKQLGKAIPYGVYDLRANEGWVSVGISHDTAQFATETLRQWWWHMGAQSYPQATKLLITADAGGSNGPRCRLWKVALQELADSLGLQIAVCHFPPGTSKWNKIEHRMFCHIAENWRGRPLISHAVVVNLIGNTTTRTGLRIRAKVDKKHYQTGIPVTDEQLAAVQLREDGFHGEWNYTISPRH
jgi:transposase